MSKNDVTLRLSVKGREELLKTMRDMGGEYAKAAKRIDAGSKEANAGIKTVNLAAKEGKGALEDYAQRGGILGRVLKDLGPMGLVAGAAIGGVTLALGAALKVSREAVKAFDEIGKSADTLQLSTDAFQSLKAAAADEGVEFSKVETAARSLTKAHTDLMRGTGQLYSSLKDTNPQLLEMLRNTTSNDERLRILTTALQSAQSQTERNTIAYAAFGESGLDVARMLERQEGGIDAMITKYREMGLVVREDVIRNAEDMETKFGVAAQVMDLQLKQAFVNLAPVLIEAAELIADVATGIYKVIEAMRDLEDRGTGRLQQDRAWAGQTLAATRWIDLEQVNKAIREGTDIDVSNLTQAQASRLRANIEKFNEANRILSARAETERVKEVGQIRQRLTVEQLTAERDALKDHLAQMDKITQEQRQSGEIAMIEDPFAADRKRVQSELDAMNAELARRAAIPGITDPQAAAAAAAAAKAREAELNRLRTEAIALQKQLGDYTAYLANETARYQTLLDEGLITPDQYAAAVKSLTDELTGTTAAMEVWVGMIEAARSPVDVITDKMDQLDADLVAGKINIDLYRQAMELLTGEMAKAADAATQASPGYKDAEAIRGELERAATEALSPAARLAKEQERVKALVDGGNLGDIEATEWLMLYKKRLDDAADSMGLLAASERLLDDVQSGRIKTWGDMKRAFGEMLIDMVRNYMAAQTQMQGGGFLDFVMGAGKGFLGSFFGGGAGAGNPVPGAAHANIGASHTGALGSNPLQTRRLAAGRLGNERLQYIREDEEVLTSYGKMNIAAQLSQLASERAAMSGLVSRALMGAGGGQGGPMKVTVHNYAGAEVETTQREGPEGPEVSIDIRGKMKDLARGGVFDGPFKERYGLVPNT